MSRNLSRMAVLYQDDLGSARVDRLLQGLAVCEALEDWLTKSAVQLKWPNDVFVQQRKICGILLDEMISIWNRGEKIIDYHVILGSNIPTADVHDIGDEAGMIW